MCQYAEGLCGVCRSPKSDCIVDERLWHMADQYIGRRDDDGNLLSPQAREDALAQDKQNDTPTCTLMWFSAWGGTCKDCREKARQHQVGDASRR